MRRACGCGWSHQGNARLISDWFLWPAPRLRAVGLFGGSASLEARLADRFEGFPVLVSSARVGMVLGLEHLGVTRPDPVSLFPYASHCVIEAVGRVGAPIAGRVDDRAPYRVLYHQWGYVQERPSAPGLIEDAVDTFCDHGAELFPAGGDFEVWSLPKLTGCLGGGVLWCRSEEAARSVRELRDVRCGLDNLRWLVRAASVRWPALLPLWHGAESAGGKVPGWARADVAEALDRWSDIAAARRERLALLKAVKPSWISFHGTRLPTAVPLEVSDEVGSRLSNLGFSAGFRHFELVTDRGRELRRVFPIPIHQDVPLQVLHRAVALILGS